MGDLWISQQRRGVVLVWGDFWVLQKRRGILLVRETYEYHSRGKEYIVLFQRDLWVPQQTEGVWC